MTNWSRADGITHEVQPPTPHQGTQAHRSVVKRLSVIPPPSRESRHRQLKKGQQIARTACDENSIRWSVMKTYQIRPLSSRQESRQSDADERRQVHMHNAEAASPRRIDGCSVEAVRQKIAR